MSQLSSASHSAWFVSLPSAEASTQQQLVKWSQSSQWHAPFGVLISGHAPVQTPCQQAWRSPQGVRFGAGAQAPSWQT